ncbi:hypothetical protein [Bacillus sp. S10(2024)]|uniref:hypothetical protein n=1 Tax=Bacillus sp. S10(2024) TaxID=3162886 RepID=UPI003D19A194
MFIYQLLTEYKKRFGFKNTFLQNIKMNKWIILYLLATIALPIFCFYLVYLNFNFETLIVCVAIYILLLYIWGEEYKKKTFKLNPSESLGYNVRPFRKMLQEDFSITTDEQLLRLDEVIKRKIAAEEYNRKIPLVEVVRQLSVAIPVTGLLSYAFFEIREGKEQHAQALIAVYIVCIGFVWMLGVFFKQVREFGSSSYLHDISLLIQLALLEGSIQENLKKEKISVTHKKTVLRSRKRKKQ